MLSKNHDNSFQSKKALPNYPKFFAVLNIASLKIYTALFKTLVPLIPTAPQLSPCYQQSSKTYWIWILLWLGFNKQRAITNLN